MFSSYNSQQGLYQVGFPIHDVEGNERLVDEHVPEGQVFWSIAHDYRLNEDTGGLIMDVDISYQEDPDAAIDTETIVSVEISREELKSYKRFLETVVAMIDAQLEPITGSAAQLVLKSGNRKR
jgi:hypothetical protein